MLRFHILTYLVISFLLAGCGEVASLKIVAGLDQATLEKVDAINQRLADGVNVGPETRELIEQFNKTGFAGEEGIEVAQELVRIIEEGINAEVGLNQATLNSVNRIGEIIDDQPEKWGEQGQLLVKLLGYVGTELADELAKDVEQLSTQVSNDISGLRQGLGEDARCTMAYGGEKIDYALEEAGGRFFSGVLYALTGVRKEGKPLPKLASICTIEPREVNIIWRDGKQVADKESRTLRVSGFNFTNADPPKVYLQSADDQPIDTINLIVKRPSPFLLEISLHRIDFTDVIAPGSSIALEWPEQLPEGKFAKLLTIEDAPTPIAGFTAGETNGPAPWKVKFYDASKGQPESWYWDFGDGHKLDGMHEPEHEYKCPGVYTVKLEVKNRYVDEPNTYVATDFVTVEAVSSLTANFVGIPRTGTGQVEVTFTDQSIGATYYEWNFGKGILPATGKGPHTITYPQPGKYPVTLTVRDECGNESTHTMENYITVAEIPPPPVAKFSASKTKDYAPLTVKFTDQSDKNPTAWSWDFGDKSEKATSKNPTHVFSKPGKYTVTLVASHAYGKSATEQTIEVVPAAKWDTATWKTVGARKTHKNDTAEWCPTGYFLVQLDLDEAHSGASDGQRPIVGQAKCAQLAGDKSTQWSPSEPVKIDISGKDGTAWCPNGSFLTSIDYDGCSGGGDCPKPVFAYCSQSPYFTKWQSLSWQEVEDSHRRDSGGWCKDGTFLVGLDHGNGGGHGRRHPYRYPIIRRALCAKPVAD